MAMDSTGIQCTATTRAGQPCQHNALPGSSFCWWHDPQLADQRKEARSKGGRARHGRHITGSDGEYIAIGDLSDVLKLIEREINEIRQLERSNSRGNTIARLATVAAADLVKQSKRAHRVTIPKGDDLTAFHSAGGDLAAWVTFQRAAVEGSVIPWVTV